MTGNNQNKFNLTNEIIFKVLKGVSFRMQKLKEVLDEYEISFSNNLN